MNKFRFTLMALAVMAFTLMISSSTQAQATRTWVSGVGDDVNPCSRTAPCKTFAGAISKTFIHGEISVLDPGGFGTINITKSITLDGTTGSGYGSILASGTVGVTVNIAVNGNDPFREVVLRNLTINGTGSSGAIGTRTGTKGVRFIQGLSLTIDNCRIFHFSQEGIDANLTADSGQLHVRDTTIYNNTLEGIKATTSVGQIRVSLDNVASDRNSMGLHVVNNASVFASNFSARNNTSHGVQIENNTSANLDHSTLFGNVGNGLNAGAGAPTVRISDTGIINNLGGGVNIAGGTVFTFGDNKIRGNGGVGDVAGGALNGTTTKQ